MNYGHTWQTLGALVPNEMRFGQKVRVCHRWFTRGQRPPRLYGRRYVYPESVRIRCGVFTAPVGWDSLIGMSGAILTAEDRAHLLRMMRRQTPSPVHRRMNALLLLDDGWAVERVAVALFIDAETVREHRRLYQTSGIAGVERLTYEGSEPALAGSS